MVGLHMSTEGNNLVSLITYKHLSLCKSTSQHEILVRLSNTHLDESYVYNSSNRNGN